MKNLYEDSLKRLKELQEYTDYEMAHGEADGILEEILIEEGYEEIVEAYREVGKWYA